MSALLLAAWALSGCGGDPPPKSNAKAPAAASAPVPDANGPSSRCQTLLASAIAMMKPDSLGITSDPPLVADSLNNWVRDCGKSLAGNDAAKFDPAMEKYLTPLERAIAPGEMYDVLDVEHVRNCWMFKLARTATIRSTMNDLDRVVALFEYAVRLVGLWGPEDPPLPQSLYETALFGKGSPEDRAWVFAELLRQSGVDALILKPRPTGGAAASPPRWLVGVPLDKQVYLFDPSLGWPIPSRADKPDTPTVRKVATLADVLADDGLLRKLDVSPEKPYPLRSADLKSLDVQVITSSTYWFPRMKRLEAFLSGDRSATIYAPLGDMGGRPGLLSRAAAAGNGLWKKEDVTVWDYPQRQRAAATADVKASKLRTVRWLPFEGPLQIEFDKQKMQWSLRQEGHKVAEIVPYGHESPKVTETELRSRLQIKSRMAQLDGDYAGAVRNYLLVQLEELPPAQILPREVQEEVATKMGKPNARNIAVKVPEREFVVNYRAAEDAKFWMAVCQFEQREYDAAAETSSAYVRRYLTAGGSRIPEAYYLHGLSLAMSAKLALAVQSANQILHGLPENDPRRPTFELFAARWRAGRDAAAQSKPDEKPDQPKGQQPATTNAAVQPPAGKAAAPPNAGPAKAPKSTSPAAPGESKKPAPPAKST